MSTQTDRTYNGWTNYETWCVDLWLSNEEILYRYWLEYAQAAWDDATDPVDTGACLTRSGAARSGLAHRMKDEIEAEAPLSTSGDEPYAGLGCDLVSAALSGVNWDEIANGWLGDVEGYVDVSEDEH